MNPKQREILKLEEDFKDMVQSKLAEKQYHNKTVSIENVELVGKAVWQDRINGKPILENVFIVKCEIKEIDENGNERKTKQDKIYLGNRCIGARMKNESIQYNSNIEISEPDKIKAVEDLLDSVPEEVIEKNSLNALKVKEMAEVLSIGLNKEFSEDDVERILKNGADFEVGKKKDDIKEKSKDNSLKNQVDKIRIKSIQRVDLNQKVDGKRTAKKVLDLEKYDDDIYVINSEDATEIDPNAKINNTVYTFVGITKSGKPKLLNDEFEMDKSVGSSASRKTTKVRQNNTATRDNKDLSVYTRKSNGASIGCENNKGNVDLFLYGKTREENENTGIQFETDKTKRIPLETKVLFSEGGINKRDEIQNEIEEKTKNDEVLKDRKDFDGDEKTFSDKCIDPEKIDRDDYIPNTNMKWGEFIVRCGYRGEGELEKAVEVVSKMPKVDQESLEKFIKDIEEKYEEDIMHKE